MKRKQRGDFQGDFGGAQEFKITPIKGVFGGAAPDSLYASNVQSAWARWRRGIELAVAHFADDNMQMPFRYQLIVPGVTTEANAPSVGGVLVGFPTANKELGMHWAGYTVAGNLRFDQLQGTNGTATISGEIPKTQLYNGQGQDNDEFWYIQINGSWSSTNPLPPPLFVQPPFPGAPAQFPINTFPLADRILVSGGAPITNESRDPSTNVRYGYTEAVLVDLEPFTGVLRLEKSRFS